MGCLDGRFLLPRAGRLRITCCLTISESRNEIEYLLLRWTFRGCDNW